MYTERNSKIGDASEEKTQFLDCVRYNIGEFTIGKLRELLRLLKPNFGLRSVYTQTISKFEVA